MWVCLNDAFLSIVAHRTRPADLLVRARWRGDIERVFPRAVTEHTPRADYPYRTILPRAAVATALAEAADAIDYENFKASVREEHRHEAYFGIWRLLRAAGLAR